MIGKSDIGTVEVSHEFFDPKDYPGKDRPAPTDEYPIIAIVTDKFYGMLIVFEVPDVAPINAPGIYVICAGSTLVGKLRI